MVQDNLNQQKYQKWFRMAECQGKGFKTPVNGLFNKSFEFGPLFGYDIFQNEIDPWETTVHTDYLLLLPHPTCFDELQELHEMEEVGAIFLVSRFYSSLVLALGLKTAFFQSSPSDKKKMNPPQVFDFLPVTNRKWEFCFCKKKSAK